MPIYRGIIRKNKYGEVVYLNITEIFKDYGEMIISTDIIKIEDELKNSGGNCAMCGKLINKKCWISYETAGYNFYKENNVRMSKKRPIYLLNDIFCTKKCYKLKKLTE